MDVRYCGKYGRSREQKSAFHENEGDVEVRMCLLLGRRVGDVNSGVMDV